MELVYKGHSKHTQAPPIIGRARVRTNEDDAQAIADDVLRAVGVVDADVAGRGAAAGLVVADDVQAFQVRAEAQAPNCTAESRRSTT